MVNVKSNVGSIGSAGEPFADTISHRVKGIYPDVIRDMHDVNLYLGEARRLRDSSQTSRITLRFIAPLRFEIPNAEAVIPLAGKWEGYQLLYYGENLVERLTPQPINRREDELVSWVLANKRTDNALERARGLGYTVGILSSPSSEDLEYLTGIYSEAFSENGRVKYMFEINRDTVRELVTTPTSRVAIARNYEGKIVSVIIGETSVINTSRGSFEICEYSDEATLKAHRRHGLSQACLQLLGSQLYTNGGVDLLYAEARALNIGANKVPANLGYRHAGRLAKHCLIGGDKDIETNTDFEDLNVWYLPKVKK